MKKAQMAGLLHDAAKEMSPEDVRLGIAIPQSMTPLLPIIFLYGMHLLVLML